MKLALGCHIPSSLRNGADFRSIPVPPCSSCDVSAVTASHGASQGGVFKLPKPALTALCSSHGLEISLERKSCWEKKKSQKKTQLLSPPKNPKPGGNTSFLPKNTPGGESSQDVSEWLQSSKRQKPMRRSLAFWHGGNKPKSCCWRSVAASQRGRNPGPAGIITPQAGALKSLGYDRFRGKGGREDHSHLLSLLTHVSATTKASLEAPHSGQQSPGKIYY